MGNENSSPPPPPSAAATVANPAEDMGQTYNPWRIWSPTIGRRSSDPWSNSHYPHENWNPKLSERKELESRSWYDSECKFFEASFSGACWSWLFFPSSLSLPPSHTFITCSSLKSILQYGSVRLQISLGKSGCGRKSNLQPKLANLDNFTASYFTICHFYVGSSLNYKMVLACNTFMEAPVLIFKFFPVLPSNL